jgi:hypothetical protein
MTYNSILFATDKEEDYRTPYRYQLTGAFYEVYTNGEGDYHMSKEDKASLEERVHFYKEDVVKGKYPIYDSKFGMVQQDAPIGSIEVLTQVLGLPVEMIMKKDSQTGKVVSKTPEEVLASISFEDNLYFGYGSPTADLNESVLKNTNLMVAEAINYLISHGFYFLETDQIIDETYEPVYPVFIDESKIPAKYLKVKETSDKLLIDFVKDPLAVTPDIFLKIYKPLDSMPLAKKYALAFSEDIPGKEGLQEALRNYFYAIFRSLLNEYFGKYFANDHVFSRTVLDHEIGLLDCSFPFIAIGSHLRMTGADCRRFEKNGDSVKETLAPNIYSLSPHDKKNLESLYPWVKSYFDCHPDLGYLPSLFIRELGLPYEAFEIARFFDFRRGTLAQFLALFDVLNPIDYEGQGILTPLPDDQGVYRYPGDTPRLTIPDYCYYTNSFIGHGFYLSNPYAFFKDPMNQSYLLFFTDKADKKILPLLKGNSRAYLRGLEKYQANHFDVHQNPDDLSDFKGFLMKDLENGDIVPSIRDYFAKLNQGKTSLEALGELALPEIITPRGFMLLILNVFKLTLEPEVSKYFHKITSNLDRKHFEAATFGDFFEDPYLPLPSVHKGHYFIGYSKDDTSEIYFDSSDKEALINLHEMFRTFFLPHGSFPYAYSSNGLEMMHDIDFPVQTDFLLESFWLGLPVEAVVSLDPLKDPISQLRFQDHIGMDQFKDHHELISKDDSLRYCYIVKEMARRGILPLGRDYQSKPFYCLRKKADPLALFYLSPDVIKNYLLNDSVVSLRPDIVEDLKQSLAIRRKMVLLDDDAFRDQFLAYVLGKQPGNLNNATTRWVYAAAVSYSGLLRKAFYESISHELFQTETSWSLGSYRYQAFYVAPGSNFYAYSLTGEWDSFTLDQSDFAVLKSSLETLRVRTKALSNKEEKARVITHDLGLPAVFTKKLYHLLRTTLKPSDEALTAIFGFTPRPNTVVNRLPSYLDDFHINLSENHFGKSTYLNHELLSQGLFFAKDTDILTSDAMSMESLVSHLDETFQQITSYRISLSQTLSGDIRNIFRPLPAAYASSVDFYLNEIKAYCQDNNYLFFLKENLIALYDSVPDFLVKGINLLHDGSGKAFLSYFRPYLHKTDTPLLKMTTQPEWILYGIAYFLFLQEQMLVFFIAVSISEK